MLNTTPTEPVHVDDEALVDLIERSEVPVLVDFYADWCAPCRFMAPVLDRFARENAGKVVVAKVDTEASPDQAMRLGIRGIPTLVLFVAGREVDRQVGAAPAEYLENMLATAGQ